jgi:hypothetical protein
MSASPGIAQIYPIGDKVIAAALAGIGGVYRELPGAETARLDDPQLSAMLLTLLARSEISTEALNRAPVPAAKTAFAKARTQARKVGVPFRMLQLRRDDDGALHVMPFHRDPDGRGLLPAGEERRIDGITALWNMIAAQGGGLH